MTGRSQGTVKKNWRNTLMPAGAFISDAVAILNDGGFEVALVMNNDSRLFGTVTDGDVRRGLLKKLSMESSVIEIMCANPLTATPDASPEDLLKMMRAEMIRQIPLLDDTGELAGLVHIRDLTQPVESRENWVVLMAGGLGKRLMPLTKQTPKPLLKVGDKPLLQSILENFIEQGFRHFYISVNYKADSIKEHFGAGEK